jgi:1,4-alpha-glucan branching enzyme
MTQPNTPGPDRNTSALTSHDIYLFNEGRYYRAYDKLGAHLTASGGTRGTSFAVWAPNAHTVSVIGSFNEWNPESHPMRMIESSGIWETFVPGVGEGAAYKYHISSKHLGFMADKADPFGFRHEQPPRTASVVWGLEYEWGDHDWMAKRGQKQTLGNPISIYEVHLGSWMRVAEDNYRSLTYREIAPRLAEYVNQMGFTHVELLPVMEHPFYLVDHLHQHGIGVLLDWVPSHFPSDGHGLAYFDGTHLYEHADSRQGFHPDWKTHIFNYGRTEVRTFLLSNAMFWLEKYHADGLRVDAVASMLYLDYSRKEGEWIPNQYGGRENLEAIDFLRQLNEEAYKEQPGIQMIAEESTAWPMVSRPVYLGGLGFGLKWDMGWMHDTLKYFQNDPIHRRYHHNLLTFRMLYGYTENFVLPLSHDEVVHGKGSLINKMPGDEWQQFANLRVLFGYMFAQSGKKMLFMGCEFGQRREWGHDSALDWEVLRYPHHKGLQKWVEQLNHFYSSEKAMHELDADPAGFEWVDCNDSQASVVSLLRKGKEPEDTILVVCNFTPVPREEYRVGVPAQGFWREVLNGDAIEYGGSGWGNMGGKEAQTIPSHGRPYSLNLTLPPLAAVFLKVG